MNIALKDNMWINGETYSAGKTYDFPRWLAKVYIDKGMAKIPKKTFEREKTFEKVEKKKKS